eukprot:284877-Chlamydomonas_euryale.AAC.1
MLDRTDLAAAPHPPTRSRRFAAARASVRPAVAPRSSAPLRSCCRPCALRQHGLPPEYPRQQLCSAAAGERRRRVDWTRRRDLLVSAAAATAAAAAVVGWEWGRPHSHGGGKRGGPGREVG